MQNDPHIVILAAGKGRRMHSQRQKVLHPVLFRPMVEYVLDLAASLPHQSSSLVAAQGDEEISRLCLERRDLRVFRQELPLGTGDAVKSVESFLKLQEGPVLVLSGDLVLLEAASLRRMLERHLQEQAACTIATATLSNPGGYGRILRRLDGSVADVREQSDCTPAERAVNEINAGIYFFAARELFEALAQVTDSNAQREYYLTDVVKVLAAGGRRVVPYAFGDPLEVLGIKNRYDLWKTEALLQERVNKELMHRGVTLQDPRATWIDPRCRIEEDVRIEAGCVLVNTSLESGVTVEGHCRIENSAVGARTRIRAGSYIEDSVIGAGCSVGPYARLRPQCRLEGGVKVGNFVELKKSRLGRGSKAAHLSYIGDAEIGRNVNVGCGFVTCNYDGRRKHKTVVEDGAFIGSGCQAVAPLTVGRDSYVAAGTTLTEDVPAQSLAISRGRQVTKAGYAAKYRRGEPAGEAGQAPPVPAAGGAPYDRQ